MIMGHILGEVHHVVPLRALDKFRINFPKIPRPRALLTGPACAGSQNSLSTFHKGSQYKPHQGQVKDSPNLHLQGQGQGAYRYIDSDVSPSVVWSHAMARPAYSLSFQTVLWKNLRSCLPTRKYYLVSLDPYLFLSITTKMGSTATAVPGSPCSTQPCWRSSTMRLKSMRCKYFRTCPGTSPALAVT